MSQSKLDNPAAKVSIIGPDKPWLAPLAGFSDLPFRLLCREYGAAAACTEMVSAKGLLYQSPGTEAILATAEIDSPLVVQLFGSEEPVIARAMEILLDRGFSWFDLNCGCPVKKVVKTGAGAALLRDEESRDNLVRIARRMAELAPGRTGVKLRLGWFKGEDHGLILGGELERAGAAWLTMHPRYARQGFSGQADWPRIREMVERVSIPVMASGDLFTAEDGRACIEQSRAAGVMFARGAMSDPAVFMRFLGREPEGSEREAVWRIIRRHVDLSRIWRGDRSAFLKMRTFIPRYVRNFPGSRELRKEITWCRDWLELEKLLAGFLGRD